MVKKVLLVGLIVIFLMLTASCQEKKDSGKENNEVSSGVWLAERGKSPIGRNSTG